MTQTVPDLETEGVAEEAEVSSERTSIMTVMVITHVC